MTTLQFEGLVATPAERGGPKLPACGGEGDVHIRFDLDLLLAEFSNVAGGELDLATLAVWTAMPVASGLATVSFLALVVDEDSAAPVSVFIGTTPATDGSLTIPIGGNLVVELPAVPGNKFWIKGGSATLRMVAAGT